MSLSKLEATSVKSKKRVGRGYGSGKGGHTSGRGAKGQKARNKLPLYFEGTSMRKSLIRRMPMFRGKLKFKSLKKSKPLILNLKHLELLPKGTLVNLDSLIKFRLLPRDAKDFSVKILGDGDLTKALTVALPASKSAIKKIESAGGQLVKSEAAAPKAKVKPKVKPKKK